MKKDQFYNYLDWVREDQNKSREQLGKLTEMILKIKENNSLPIEDKYNHLLKVTKLLLDLAEDQMPTPEKIQNMYKKQLKLNELGNEERILDTLLGDDDISQN